VGANYRGHEGRLQDIDGYVRDASKLNYSVGGALALDWAPGDIYYGALAAKQRAIAADHLVEKVRLDTIRTATERYYALLKAEASLAVMAEDIAISERYYQQLEGAVKVGTAFRADQLRVGTQLARLRLLVRLGEEELQVCAARLAETLRLAPETALRSAKVDLTPVRLLKDEKLTDLVARAQTNRAEVKAVDAAAVGLAKEEDRVRVGPLFPTLQGGYAAGGFGGGRSGRTGNFGDQQDFFVGLGWKVGPGGIFDTTRNKIAETRRESVALQKSRVKASIGREVVEAVARSQSAYAQIQITDEAVAAAEEMTKLAGERQASQIGVVLEYVMARDELRQARLARVRSVVDFNCAQQELQLAVGEAPASEK
jgi:outer membrane protein TolC